MLLLLLLLLLLLPMQIVYAKVKMMHKFWHLSTGGVGSRNARAARQLLWSYLFVPASDICNYNDTLMEKEGGERNGGQRGRGGLFRWLTQIRRTHLEIVYERAATTTWIALSTRKQHDKTNRRAKAYIYKYLYIYMYIYAYIYTYGCGAWVCVWVWAHLNPAKSNLRHMSTRTRTDNKHQATSKINETFAGWQIARASAWADLIDRASPLLLRSSSGRIDRRHVALIQAKN